jgi:hypothetical protein
VHSRSTPRFAHHPDGRTEYPEADDRERVLETQATAGVAGARGGPTDDTAI